MGQLKVRLAGEWQDVNVSTSIFAMWTLDWTDNTINTSRESGARAKTAAGTIRRLGGNNPVVTDKNIKRLFWSLELPIDDSDASTPWFCTVLDRNGATLYDTTINVSTGIGAQPTGEFPLPAGKDSFDEILNIASVQLRFGGAFTSGPTFTLARESFRLIGVSEADIIPAGQPPDKPVLAPAPPTTTSSAIYANVKYTLPADNGSQILRTEFNYRRQTIKGTLPGEADQSFPWRKTFDNTSFVVEERHAPYEVWCRVEYTLVQGGEKFWGEESDTIVTISGELLPEIVTDCPPEGLASNYLLTSNTIEGATSYQFQIANPDDFTDIWVNRTVMPIAGDSSVSIQGRLALPDEAPYAARVRALYGRIEGIYTSWSIGETCGTGINQCRRPANPSLSCVAVALADGSAGTITFTARSNVAERYILEYTAGSGNPITLSNSTGVFTINNAPIGVIFVGTARVEITCPEGTEQEGEKRLSGPSASCSDAVTVPCNSRPNSPVLSVSGSVVSWNEPSAGTDDRATIKSYEVNISGKGVVPGPIPLAASVRTIDVEEAIQTEAGETYTVRVVAINSCTTNNRSRIASTDVLIPEEDEVECPTVPTSVRAGVSTARSDVGYGVLRWGVPEDAKCDTGISGYVVKYTQILPTGQSATPVEVPLASNARSYSLIRTGKDRPDAGEPNLIYDMQVKAITACCPTGSEFSSTVRTLITAKDAETCDPDDYNNRPSAVTNLKRRNTTIATTVAISYTSPSRKGKNTDCQPYTDSDIDYLLQYTRANPLNPNQPITLSETSEGNQIFLRDLVSNTKYTVRVIANNPNGRGLNADGSEAWSEPIEFTTNVDCPGPVTSAKAVKNEDHETLADNTVTLSWVAPLYTGNSRIRNYQIKQVGTEGGVNASYIALSTSRTTPVLRPGKYKFSIKPVNAAATPGCLNEVETNEIQVFGPPTTPRNSSIKVNDTGDGFLFGWSPPRSNGGRVVTKYNISIVSEDIFDDKVARIFGFTTGVSTTDQDHEFEFNTTSYRIGTTPLRFKRGQSVRMAVQAVNPEGTSGYSTSITGTIPFERPSVVTGMVTSWDTIRLQLIALFEASSDDGGKPITSYESQLRRNGITVATESITGTDLTQPVIGTGFEGALLEAGVYQIRVRPVNEVGPGRWVTKNVERPLTAPSIPQSLRVESFDQSSIFYSSRYIFQGPINWGGTPISQRQIQIDFRDQNEIRNIDQNIGTSSPYESAFRGTTPLRAFRDHRIRAVNSIVETGKFDSTPISASAWLEWADNDGPAITP